MTRSTFPNRSRNTVGGPLRIAVTGHRLDKLGGVDIPLLQARLREVLSAIDVALREMRGPATAAVDRCVLVSALAEGADRLVVDAAPADWPVAALLPMPRDIYRRDFLAPGESTSPSAEAFDAYLAQAASVTELPMLAGEAAAEGRIGQYAALGHVLAGDSDCLVTIWDGSPPRGPGGTGYVLLEASALGRPIVWIDPRGDCPAREIRSFTGSDLASPESGLLDAAALSALLRRAAEA